MASPCNISAIPYPDLPGASFLSGTALPVLNYTASILPLNQGSAVNITSLDFCNVTLTYTHPGQNDTINVKIFLPSSSSWNGRFMGTGGGGFDTGAIDTSMTPPVSEGYVAAGTDGGHYVGNDITNPTAFYASDWAHVSPGNVNLYLLQDFASVALNDMTIIGKSVAASYYGRNPDYSYWNGCSTGGRQGMMMAQRYPEGYDGILAGAPGINWANFVPAMYWPQFIMNQLGVYPSACEMDAITAAGIQACDGLDGVADGILSAPALCNFHANATVGRKVSCADGSALTISAEAAMVAQAAWDGPRDEDGSFLWYRLNPSSPLGLGTALTICADGNANCTGWPVPFGPEWISLFVVKNASFALDNVTQHEFARLIRSSVEQYASIIGTADPDLSTFKETGGKILMWHGLSDELVPPPGTEKYYREVERRDLNVRDYYRLFEAPGVQHCSGGNGPFPTDLMGALIKWVEEGVAPEVVEARIAATGNATEIVRHLCQYPLVQKYVGGDSHVASSFVCSLEF
ncbi:uncharacterized protein EAE98_003168 [Botrytis deweyae]|uniref:Carboxylic ester hydrolase n=1 Tax=Botrytis deweyae TaxID=2478750 RepID=A0ABQ7IVU8_9HELO|nr:uncharacterized protein EAE98_003168 [Botrytis deweyae]KAF7935123.1 hypothetical protein EAE98_003168 [Botrytis deweyae]